MRPVRPGSPLPVQGTGQQIIKATTHISGGKCESRNHKCYRLLRLGACPAPYHHPEAKITSITGRSAAGEKLSDVFPHLSDLDMVIQPELDGSLDMVFSALPHKASAEAVIPLLEDGIKVVDISADFRLRQVSEYEEWYGVTHPGPQYLEEAVYGLTELNRPEVTQTRLVANPGCYPTSAILALVPALKEGLIEPDIIVDAKSGSLGRVGV